MAYPVIKAPEVSCKLFTGTSGWTDQSLAQCGKFYPASFKSAAAAEKLKFYSSAKGNFGTVEVNTTNYSIPDLNAVAAWADATPEGFVIHVKLLGLLANGFCKASMLPADIKKKMPGIRGNTTLYSFQIPRKLRNTLWARFNAVCATLLTRGKMGLVLVQLMADAGPDEGSFRHLCAIRRRLFHSVRMAVEIRNRAWYNTSSAGTLFSVFQAIEDGHETMEELSQKEAKAAAATAAPEAAEGEPPLPNGQAETFSMADCSFARRALLNMPLARRLVHRPSGEAHELFAVQSQPRTPANFRALEEQLKRHIKDGEFVPPPDSHQTPPHPRCNQAALIAMFITLGIVHVASDDLVQELFPKVSTSVPIRMPVYPLVTSAAATYARIHRRKGDQRLLSPQEIQTWATRCRVMQGLQQRLACSVSFPLFSMEATWGDEGDYYVEEQEAMEEIMEQLCRVQLPEHPKGHKGIPMPEHTMEAAPCPFYVPAGQPAEVDGGVRLLAPPGAQFVLWGTDHEDQPVQNARALRAALGDRGDSGAVFDWAAWVTALPPAVGESKALTSFFAGASSASSSSAAAQAGDAADDDDEVVAVVVEGGDEGGSAPPSAAPAAKSTPKKGTKRTRAAASTHASPAAPQAEGAAAEGGGAGPAAPPAAKRTAASPASKAGAPRQSRLTAFFGKR